MKGFRILFVGSLLAMAVTQPIEAQEISAGVRGGFNSSELANKIVDFGGRGGLSIGIFGNFSFASGFGLMPEIYFTQKGSDGTVPRIAIGEDSLVISSTDFKTRINYLEIQLPLVYGGTVGSARTHPRIYAGPAFAFELSCSTEQGVQGAQVEADCEEEIQTPDGPQLAFVETNKFDVGILFGAGLDIDTGAGMVTVDLRYNFGLANINSERGGEFSIENRSLQVLVGYGIRLK